MMVLYTRVTSSRHFARNVPCFRKGKQRREQVVRAERRRDQSTAPLTITLNTSNLLLLPEFLLRGTQRILQFSVNFLKLTFPHLARHFDDRKFDTMPFERHPILPALHFRNNGPEDRFVNLALKLRGKLHHHRHYFHQHRHLRPLLNSQAIISQVAFSPSSGALTLAVRLQ